MKLNAVIACIFFSVQFLSSQTLILDHKNDFGFKVPPLINNLGHDTNVEDLSIDFALPNTNNVLNFVEEQQHLNTEKLNAKLFSSIRLTESTYLDQEQFIRGCGYLEDGITNPIDGADMMFSMVLNNFVNNVLFPKGIFFRN